MANIFAVALSNQHFGRCNVAAGASAKGTLNYVPILPIESIEVRLLQLIKSSRLVVIPSGPYAIIWTHADQVNSVLLDLLKERK
jgi:pimeloyl-ACP methyl ester carboxylesterase